MNDTDQLFEEFVKQKLIFNYESYYSVNWKILRFNCITHHNRYYSKEKIVARVLKWLLNERY